MQKKQDDQIQFEIGFFEKILKEDPNFIEALQALAGIYTSIGEYQKGLQLDKRLSSILPEDELAHYNLACSYSLTGILDKSLQELEISFKLGYQDWHHLKQDKDFENLRKNDKTASVLKKLIATYIKN